MNKGALAVIVVDFSILDGDASRGILDGQGGPLIGIGETACVAEGDVLQGPGAAVDGNPIPLVGTGVRA